MAERNKRDGVFVIQDGTETPNEITLACEVGDFTWDKSNPMTILRDRGVITGARAADDEVCKGSMTLNHVALCSDLSDTVEEDPTLYEILHSLAAAASWESTSDAGYAKTCRVIFWVLNPDADGKDEKTVFEKVLLDTFNFAEGDPDTEKFSFIDLETAPTVTRDDYSA